MATKAKPSPPKPARPVETPPAEPQPTNVDKALRFAARFRRFAWDMAGILVLMVSLMTLLALPGIPGLAGGLLAAWGHLLRVWFGYGSWLVPLVGMGVGLLLLRKRGSEPLKLPWMRIFALEGTAFTALVLTTLSGGGSLLRAEQGLDGGRIGWGLAEGLRLLLSQFGFTGILWRFLIVTPIFFVFLLYGFGLEKPLLRWSLKTAAGAPPPSQPNADEPAMVLAPIGEATPSVPPAQEQKKKHTLLPAEFRKRLRVDTEEENLAPPPPRDDRLPPLSLLVNESSSRPDERNINLTAGMIEKTLSEFGIPAKVISFRAGPTVTQFAVEPGFIEKEKPASAEKPNPEEEQAEAVKQKVRVAQISNLQRDLALALSAERLRIEAPVPGRPYVGIEVPNSRSSVVRLRPILETEAFYKVASPLAIALGRDVSGQPVVADLAGMPHLLVAGTTGSGKSVCIAALTTCLVMNNTPEDLRLVMIDPKMVELVRFNGLPHIYGKVETDLERILGVLRWTVAEMDRRYKLLEEMRARHLEAYNRKVSRRKGIQPMPRIVVMIDELADLMMTAPDQTEPMLVRLAQLARAVGIHLVVATQRPGTDIITGLIKANFPARLSFAVASSIDSRVILDTTGAENLLGHGDMLFNPPDAPAPIRSQGVLVTDTEVERVITFWQQAHPVEEGEKAPWEKMLEEESFLADKDDLVSKAEEVVRQEQRCSASLLQRRLRIGYPRAARLVDELEEMGVVGPAQGGGREREVLVSRDEEAPDHEDN
jgi:DNA segregation ATPase FtsK/SpoIIIE, S-DNA-T family